MSDELGFGKIRTVLCLIMHKLAPCCRNEDIFALTLFAPIFRGYFPPRVFLCKKRRERNLVSYKQLFEAFFSYSAMQKKNFGKFYARISARQVFRSVTLSEGTNEQPLLVINRLNLSTS